MKILDAPLRLPPMGITFYMAPETRLEVARAGGSLLGELTDAAESLSRRESGRQGDYALAEHLGRGHFGQLLSRAADTLRGASRDRLVDLVGARAAQKGHVREAPPLETRSCGAMARMA